MNKREEEFHKRLLVTFRGEAQEHLRAISNGLLGLETPKPREEEAGVLETIFRACHTLKGAARAVNLTDIESICQSLEDIFDDWRHEGIKRSSETFNSLHKALESMNRRLSSMKADGTLIGEEELSRVAAGLSVLVKMPPIPESAEGGKPHPHLYPLPEGEDNSLPFKGRVRVGMGSLSHDTIKISTAKLNALLHKSEEMLAIKRTEGQRYSEVNDIYNTFDAFKRKMSAISPIEDTETSEYVVLQLKSIKNKLSALKKSARQADVIFTRAVDNLIDESKKAMMQSFSEITEGFPLLVRSVSHEQGKEVILKIQGEDVEVDRRILAEIKDPLIHIIRNCIDHGIEYPAVREANNKDRTGTISINISLKENSKVEIIISDNGKGIDIEKIKGTSIKNGLISRETAESLNDEDALSFIFHSGFSTSPLITSISGRGLGLAIVREKIDNLSGTVTVKSELNSGTAFSIIIPVTLATFRGILIRVNDQVFIVHSNNVLKVMMIKKDEIKTVENRECIVYNSRPVSYVRLKDILQIDTGKSIRPKSEYVTVLILKGMDINIAAGVDEIIEESEVLVKNLGTQLVRVRNVSVAAIMGTGRTVPVLNVSDLIRTALKNAVSALPVYPVMTTEVETEKLSILVAEDSITSRILLKNILESAGYNVRTAVDGVDAITMLKTEDFDLVVSDIEMPRMDGFGLCSKIRSDKKLAELPVVLVTALETREDREKGISVGANAYIVKSSFDQSNLIEVIRRLI
ncbi:MAG: response regulator [Nitrospirae bacterium]|nr:response regulator [Nitrospirota bacterium]